MIRMLALGVGVFGVALASASAIEKDGPNSSRPDALFKLTPAQRMNLLAKVLDKAKDLVRPHRGPIMATVTERGNLQAVNVSDVICSLRPTRKNTTISSTIKWVVDDGTYVKKGERLVELDDSSHMELVKDQRNRVARAKAELLKASETLERIKKENGIDIKVAQIDVRLADLASRQYKGNDQIQKDVLSLQVDRAALLVEKLRLRAAVKEEEAAEIVESKKAVHEQERDRQRAIEEDIARCIILAPRDGFAIYYAPEQTRFGGGPQSIVAQGEPVREGQKLMLIADLSKMALLTRIHESQIHRIRVGQKAAIRVDAFPGKAHAGAVANIATVPDHVYFFKEDRKLYRVLVTIDGENKTLKPGMSAEASITVGESANALRLPVSAVLGTAKLKYCYVLEKNELQVRQLTTGVSDGKLVEITNGLSETDVVLRDPVSVMSR